MNNAMTMADDEGFAVHGGERGEEKIDPEEKKTKTGNWPRSALCM